MKIFIIEKASFANYLICMLRESYQLMHGKDYLIVSANSIGWMQLSPPKLSLKQIPYVGPLKKKPRSENVFPTVQVTPLPLFGDLKSNRQELVKVPVLMAIDAFSRIKFSSAHIFVSNDTGGHYVAKEILELLRVNLDCVRWHNADSWRKESLLASFKVSKTTLQINNSAERHKLKREFDGWWLANGQLVFGRIFHAIGLSQVNALSKYELNTLCLLEFHGGEVAADDLFLKMSAPMGTGKYKSKSAMIGTHATQVVIFETLINKGLMVYHDSVVSLTSLGSQFLSYLHPKTKDLDLPFRIDKWLSDYNWQESKKQASRYIKQLFGRQLRYQSLKITSASKGDMVRRTSQDNIVL